MAYTKLQKVRSLIADPVRFNIDKQVADGETNIFQLSHSHIHTGSIQVKVNGEVVASENVTINYDQGLIQLDEAPAMNVLVVASYHYSVFRDEEILEYLDETGQNVEATICILLQILLADAARRFDYSVAQTDLKPSQVFKQIKELLEYYKKMVDSESDGSVGLLVDRIVGSYSEGPRKCDLSRWDIG